MLVVTALRGSVREHEGGFTDPIEELEGEGKALAIMVAARRESEERKYATLK